MTESEPDSTVSDDFSIDDLPDEELNELASRVARELESRDKETVDASLGMFNLRVESHSSLEETVEAFESVWSSRIEELEASRADCVREKLEDDETGFILG